MKTKSFKKSIKFHKKTLKYIPLASQTFSKSSLMYPYGCSPLFLEKGSGCNVWDLDNNKYIDYVLGLLPIIISYRDKDVDNSIKDQLKKGIIFSLPSSIEQELAEKLVKMIPSAEMVRFGKNGSDVTSAAIRLARAYTKREKIAMCGYHSWHDWYIGTTSRNLGVPKTVSNLSYNFNFNDLDQAEDLIKSDVNGFAAIIIEPENNMKPKKDFLLGLRKLADKYGIVLIFDEIVSGFRCDLGGAQKKYNVKPDLSTFGKGMANGMPISAIVGKREIMMLMNKIFFSGTFGGEALSIAAAIATIKKLEDKNAPLIFKKLGKNYFKNINNLINKYDLNDVIEMKGVDWRPIISFKSIDKASDLEITSLFRQELIKHGIIMGSGINLCLAHNDEKIIKKTLKIFEKSIYNLKNYLEMDNPLSKLKGESIKPVFQVR
jgi:glutamate-1-semialdehyde 2,1-aminomutase